ncbi:hypothetical protein UFOVP231_22 [uncultured Caudovirales phage]|uniref:Uncharacterized protein n=1 Tax=uncultured Caudovirales phage TaxID=2100421 RepID=A0A6J7WTE4_9CAUD|nr:hypothetical protein UFOVP231_22 [uncultured Caudovirales phage]
MATSGTYAYNPGLGELTLYAYNLIGIRNTAVLQEHMEASRMATNMMLSRWANQGVNLWAVDLQTVYFNQALATLTASGNGTTATLTYATPNTPIYAVGDIITVAGVTPTGYNGTYTVTASSAGSVSFANATTGSQTVAGTVSSSTNASTYSVNPNTVVILDSYIETVNGSGQPIDRLILPISRTEYASYPNKNQVGFSTTYWFDRLLSPTVTLWPVPDNTATSLKYYRVRQIQDANLTSNQNVEIPYLWLEAFAYGLAQRLAVIWAPDKVAILKPMADESYQIAADQNVETAQQYISPMISGYFR